MFSRLLQLFSRKKPTPASSPGVNQSASDRSEFIRLNQLAPVIPQDTSHALPDNDADVINANAIHSSVVYRGAVLNRAQRIAGYSFTLSRKINERMHSSSNEVQRLYYEVLLKNIITMDIQRLLGQRLTCPDNIKPYNVGIIRGWKILETVAAGAKSVTVVANGEQLFSMLDKGRIDIALVEKLQGMEFIKKMGLHGIKVLQPSLLEGNWYLYVNKKHENLIPTLISSLRKIEEDGTIKRINESVLKRYAQ